MKIGTFGGLIFELAWEKFPRGLTFLPFSCSLDRKLDTLVGGKKKSTKVTVTLKEMRSSLSDFLPWADSHQLRKRREGREIEFQLQWTRVGLLSENVT